MKTTTLELALNRWPYGLELKQSAHGFLLRPRRKARVGWARSFRRSRRSSDDLAATRQLRNEFDAKEWEWRSAAKQSQLAAFCRNAATNKN